MSEFAKNSLKRYGAREVMRGVSGGDRYKLGVRTLPLPFKRLLRRLTGVFRDALNLLNHP